MISVSRAREVQRLLKDGLCPRAILRITGVSRDTIASIAAGRWRGWGREEPPAAVSRCKGCGRLIELPCKACAAQSHLEQTPPRPPAPESIVAENDAPTVLDLRPAAAERYEPIHRFKMSSDPRKPPCASEQT